MFLVPSMYRAEDDESTDDDDDDEDESESEAEAESDDEAENECKNGDVDVSPKKKPLAEVNHPVVTQEEMQADMLKFGIRGTKEELIANLRWIKNNKPDTVGSTNHRQSVLPFEDFEYPELSKIKVSQAPSESKESTYEESKQDVKADAK